MFMFLKSVNCFLLLGSNSESSRDSELGLRIGVGVGFQDEVGIRIRFLDGVSGLGFRVGVDVRLRLRSGLMSGFKTEVGVKCQDWVWSRVLGRESGSGFRTEIKVRVGVGFRDGIEVGFQDWGRAGVSRWGLEFVTGRVGSGFGRVYTIQAYKEVFCHIKYHSPYCINF
ncbi:hypothetical protein TIFTF001_009916 [Ficus carica]|uniref:Uncharacterized protein n=1 Tax=Ficus carica TaxID=3494 RepID=A0AA87ZX91_FICCA|nr:hypothetical protein TIFTF001_009916 [Ficus carica]